MPHTKPHKDIEQHQIITNELAKDITLELERDSLWCKALAHAQEQKGDASNEGEKN